MKTKSNYLKKIMQWSGLFIAFLPTMNVYAQKAEPTEYVRIVGSPIICAGECQWYNLEVTIPEEYTIYSNSWGNVDSKELCKAEPLEAYVSFININDPHNIITASAYLPISDGPGWISAISGSTKIPCHDTGPRTYTVTADCPNVNYYWSLPRGWQYTSTPSGNSITVIPSDLDGGQISVFARDSRGNTTNTSSIIISRKPDAPVFKDVLYAVCSSSPVTYSVYPVPGATSYNWSVSGTGASVINIQGTAAQIQFVSSGVATICVTASSACGSSEPVCATVHYGAPADAVNLRTIWTKGCIIAALGRQVANATRYQWSYDDFTNIIAVTNVPTLRGLEQYETISVRPMNACGTGPVSSTEVNPAMDCFFDVWPHHPGDKITPYGSVVSAAGAPPISIYPNPATTSFEINLMANENVVQVDLYNMHGQLVKTLETAANKITVETSDLQEGLYMLHLQSSELNHIEKIQIVK